MDEFEDELFFANDEERLQFFFDDVIDDKIIGWIRDPRSRMKRFSVQVFVDGILVGGTLADRPRDSLVRLGHEDGCYGFAYRLPTAFGDGVAHKISVRVPEIDATAKGSGRAFRVSSAMKTLPRLQIEIDDFEQDMLTGWARNMDEPRDQILVEIRSEELLLGQVLANGGGEDSVGKKSWGKGHMFRMKLPQRMLDGEQRRISVTAPGFERRKTVHFPRRGRS